MKKTLKALLAVAALAALSGLPGVAQADGYHHDDHRDWDRHAQVAHRDWDRWHGRRPGYVYAPPVVYAPPPPSPGINLILPLNFN